MSDRVYDWRSMMGNFRIFALYSFWRSSSVMVAFELLGPLSSRPGYSCPSCGRGEGEDWDPNPTGICPLITRPIRHNVTLRRRARDVWVSVSHGRTRVKNSACSLHCAYHNFRILSGERDTDWFLFIYRRGSIHLLA
ncbi:hypothetical protein WMY93_005096 [Mugilogobius chulae]|uniref:Secreted protein n=1 Tax=Mugilogobius chulae TaxID=88201 RepID=A0AAW0PWB8_9GOBI